MQSQRRPRGRIFFEVLCAVCVGASFVGAWIQTGAWAFLGPAFIFTFFGLYWSFDMFGRDPAVAVQPAVVHEPEHVAVAEPAPVLASEPEPLPEIRFERFEAPVIEPEPVPMVAETPPDLNVVPFASEEPVEAPRAKPKKARSKKAAPPVAEPKPYFEPEPEFEPEPTAFADDDMHAEPHIEPLFDPQPFARQVRPAFGKRPRGPGPRPLPAA